jgi:hypothetical protein
MKDPSGEQDLQHKEALEGHGGVTIAGCRRAGASPEADSRDSRPPWPDAVARRRSVSADASPKADSRGSRAKARTAYRPRTSRAHTRILGQSTCTSLYKQSKSRLPLLALADASNTMYTWGLHSETIFGREENKVQGFIFSIQQGSLIFLNCVSCVHDTIPGNSKLFLVYEMELQCKLHAEKIQKKITCRFRFSGRSFGMEVTENLP